MKKQIIEVRTDSGKVLGAWEPHYGPLTASSLLVWLNKYNVRVGHKNRVLEPVGIYEGQRYGPTARLENQPPKKANFVKVVVTGSHVNARLFIKETEVYKTLEEIRDIHGNGDAGGYRAYSPYRGHYAVENATLNVSMRKVRLNATTARRLSALLDSIKQGGLKQLQYCKSLIKQAA